MWEQSAILTTMLAETVNGLYKAELIHAQGRGRRSESRTGHLAVGALVEH